MANVKIGNLPPITTVASIDVLPIVEIGTDTTYKLTIQDLANNLTQVSSSISASYASTSSYSITSSYASNGGVTSIIAGAGISVNTSTGNVTITNTAGGGGGTPGGSTQQLQYNNGGAFGGVSTAVFDGTTLRVTGSFSGSFTGSFFGSSSYAPSSSYSLSSSYAISSSYSISGSYALSSSYSLSSSYAISSSYAVSSSYSLSSSYAVSSSYSRTSSFSVSSSFSQTSSYLNNLVQNASITGSLVVSGSNGSGVFSQGITMIDYVSGISTSGSYRAWRAPFSCSVVALYGYRLEGSAAKVNAARSGSSGYGKHSSSDVTLTNDNVWTAASSIQNADYNAGDSLEIIISGSINNQIAVQVDFIKKF